nr:MAG TPA: hypothetical protein [Caudoviricetes sp.]
MGYCMYLRKGETHTEPVGDITASELAVGSTVKLNVNGTTTDFLVVHQGKPSSLYDDSCDGTWLLMKDLYENHVWNSRNTNAYGESSVNARLNTIFNMLDADIKNIVKRVTVPIDSSETVTTNMFLLGGCEVGLQNENSRFPVDGSKLDYFDSGVTTTANNKRVAKLNGKSADWWMHSAVESSLYAWVIYSNGNYYNSKVTASYGIRPALILPSDAKFDKDTLTLKG